MSEDAAELQLLFLGMGPARRNLLLKLQQQDHVWSGRSLSSVPFRYDLSILFVVPSYNLTH